MATADLPKGTTTFLFTDIEGGTRLWESAPDGTLRALASHDELVENAVASNRIFIHKARGEGDSQFAVFPSAADAETRPVPRI